MGLHIDHISLASPHIFRSADNLLKETGLGFWTGEWIGDTFANIVPLPLATSSRSPVSLTSSR